MRVLMQPEHTEAVLGSEQDTFRGGAGRHESKCNSISTHAHTQNLWPSMHCPLASKFPLSTVQTADIDSFMMDPQTEHSSAGLIFIEEYVPYGQKITE